MKTDNLDDGLPKHYNIKFSKELKEYLSKKPPEYFVKQTEFWQKELDKIKYYLENYGHASVYEFINIIEPFDRIEKGFDNLFDEICNNIKDNKSNLQKWLPVIDFLILRYKKPLIPYKKTNKIDKFLLKHYELLKEKIELQFKEHTFFDTQLKEKDYSGLYEKLKNYISDIDTNEFTEIMTHKRRSNNPKAHWIGNNADAYRFSKQFEFTIKQMNDCFTFNNGKLEANDKPKHNATKTELTKIFKELALKK